MSLSIIYTRDDVLISAKPYSSWRQIQDEFATYKASFGPWSVDEVVEFLRFEYPNLNPAVEVQVHQALLMDIPTRLTFE